MRVDSGARESVLPVLSRGMTADPPTAGSEAGTNSDPPKQPPTRSSRLSRLAERIWYGEPLFELDPKYVKANVPQLPPLLESRRRLALDYAAQEHHRHKKTARRMQIAYVVLQGTAILAAAAATVLNVAPSSWSERWVRALPAAIATLAIAALAALD